MESRYILTPNNGNYLPIPSLLCLVLWNHPLLATGVCAPIKYPLSSIHSAAPDMTATLHVTHFLTLQCSDY